jgi:murein DD-endopeptidase MepM/ murein hydrolase activator NlpD
MTENNQSANQEEYIGLIEHGTVPEPGEDGRPAGRMIKSEAWGGTPFMISVEHADDVRGWNPDCSWYQYGKQLCLNGCQHPGMDIGMPRGTALYAVVSGRVAFAGWDQYYRPHHVDITGDDGTYYIYAHMWSVDPAVQAGGRVEQGQYLGESGEQTWSGTMNPDGSGPHLHFEARRGGCAINPNDALENTKPREPFTAGDRIEVVDPPLRLRTDAGLQGDILEELNAGVALCVTGDRREADGYEWYPVRTIDGGQNGWVAGQFCRLVEKQGC